MRNSAVGWTVGAAIAALGIIGCKGKQVVSGAERGEVGAGRDHSNSADSSEVTCRFCDLLAPGQGSCADGCPQGEKLTHGCDHRVKVTRPELEEDQVVQQQADAVVLLTRAEALKRTDTGFQFREDWLGNYGRDIAADNNEDGGGPLCDTEPYRCESFVRWRGPNNTKKPRRCSGYIIAPGWVLTAEHCVRATNHLEEIRVIRSVRDVRGSFAARDVGTIVGDPAIFGKSKNKVALLRISTEDDDQVFGERIPQASRPKAKMDRSTGVYAIGHPLGLPSMVSGCAVADWSQSNALAKTTLDAHAGSSGSAVFDAAPPHDLVGIVENTPSDIGKPSSCYLLSTQGLGATKETRISAVAPLWTKIEDHMNKETKTWQ